MSPSGDACEGRNPACAEQVTRILGGSRASSGHRDMDPTGLVGPPISCPCLPYEPPSSLHVPPSPTSP